MVTNSVFGGYEFLTINVLLHTKSEQTRFLNKKYTFTICVGRVIPTNFPLIHIRFQNEIKFTSKFDLI